MGSDLRKRDYLASFGVGYIADVPVGAVENLYLPDWLIICQKGEIWHPAQLQGDGYYKQKT